MKVKTILLYLTAMQTVISCSGQTQDMIRFGLIADIQYADAETANNRYYRNSLAKLEECVAELNAVGVQFTVNLGDLTDRDVPHNLDAVLARLGKLDAPLYNTSGNHDYGGVTDNEWLYRRLGMPAEYYSFGDGGWRFIILNTNEISEYAADTTEEKAELAAIRQKLAEEGRSYAGYNGGISREQMSWLERGLELSRRESENVLIFSHHPLCGPTGLTALNDSEIIELISRYGDTVKAVIGGHHHAGACATHLNIPYITTEGMVETETANAFGIVTIHRDRIVLEGRGRTKSHTIAL